MFTGNLKRSYHESISNDVWSPHCDTTNKLVKIDGTELYFVHIPKNAGTAILKHFCNNNQVGHIKLIDINDIHIAKNSIAVIRNPYDRLYSIYKYTQLGKKNS
jgi:hypothetical protein